MYFVYPDLAAAFLVSFDSRHGDWKHRLDNIKSYSLPESLLASVFNRGLKLLSEKRQIVTTGKPFSAPYTIRGIAKVMTIIDRKRAFNILSHLESESLAMLLNETIRSVLKEEEKVFEYYWDSAKGLLKDIDSQLVESIYEYLSEDSIYYLVRLKKIE